MPAEAVEKMRPALSQESEEALLVWRHMAGWFPERLPVLVAMLDVTFVDGLLERLYAIHVAVREASESK